MRLIQREAVIENLQKLKKLSVENDGKYHDEVKLILDDNWVIFNNKPIENFYEEWSKNLCNLMENYYALYFNLKDIKEFKKALDSFAQDAIDCLKDVQHIK